MRKQLKSRVPKKAKAEQKKRQKTGAFSDTQKRAVSVYADFSIRTSKKSPKWHPVKKMRYVFFRMIAGCTITDALRELHWPPSEFWHLIDLKRDSMFREEYIRAKTLQGRAFGDAVIVIAEGRDSTTKRGTTRIQRMITKALRRAGKQKSPIAIRVILNNLMASIDDSDHRILARNKLQIDSTKWLAKAVNPAEFSDASKMALVGGGSDGDVQQPILVQFIDPSGKPVKP